MSRQVVIVRPSMTSCDEGGPFLPAKPFGPCSTRVPQLLT
jgi:hypothetical protein